MKDKVAQFLKDLHPAMDHGFNADKPPIRRKSKRRDGSPHTKPSRAKRKSKNRKNKGKK